MKILVTGAAGFIGFHICRSLLQKGHTVVGLDNINDYYDVNLKFARLGELGISRQDASSFNHQKASNSQAGFSFTRSHLEDRPALHELFENESFDVVCHLAAQAGVRYSIDNPWAYVESNIVGFLNILENCRNHSIQHLVYASSSSVYGSNTKVPFEVSDFVDHPVSLYAATKKSNELMAHTYSHLYGFPTTGLRFFTVYGPWGRPDMAYFLFTKAIIEGKPIKVFNQGNLERDFTFIDDIVEGVIRVIEKDVSERKDKMDLYKVYNIGNNQSVKLIEFIEIIEKTLGKKAEKIMMPMQAGDVEKTWADVHELIKDFGYKPKTSLTEGIQAFVEWYRPYYSSEQRD